MKFSNSVMYSNHNWESSLSPFCNWDNIHDELKLEVDFFTDPKVIKLNSSNSQIFILG